MTDNTKTALMLGAGAVALWWFNKRRADAVVNATGAAADAYARVAAGTSQKAYQPAAALAGLGEYARRY